MSVGMVSSHLSPLFFSFFFWDSIQLLGPYFMFMAFLFEKNWFPDFTAWLQGFIFHLGP